MVLTQTLYNYSYACNCTCLYNYQWICFFFTERANFDILSRSCKPSCQMAYMGNHYGKTSTLSVLVMYSYTIVLLKKKKKERYSIRHLKYILTAISALYIFNTLAYRLQKCCIFSQLTEIRNVTCKSCIHDLLFFFVGCYWGYFVQVFYKWWLDSFKQESVVMV